MANYINSKNILWNLSDPLLYESPNYRQKQVSEWKKYFRRKISPIIKDTKSGKLKWVCIRSLVTDESYKVFYECSGVILGVTAYSDRVIAILWRKQDGRPARLTKKRNDVIQIVYDLYHYVEKYAVRKNGDNESIRGESDVHKKKEISYRKIQTADFVVKTNSLTCRNEKHHTQDIIAIITIIDSDWNKREIEIRAAYCPQCQCYFIIDTDLEKVRKEGVLLCRIIEQDIFYKAGTNAFNLSSESLLKQFGYNVSEKDNLSDSQRQNILALLIDHEILTKAQIDKYLRFFIHSKKNNPIYENAVNKWRSDLEFVDNYKFNSNQRIYVNSLTVKKYHRN